MSRHLNPTTPARDRVLADRLLIAASGLAVLAGTCAIANAAGDAVSVTAAPQHAAPIPAPVTHTYGKPVLPIVGDPEAPAYPLGDGDQAAAPAPIVDDPRPVVEAPTPCRCEERDDPPPAPPVTVPAPPVVEQTAQPAPPPVTPDEEEPADPVVVEPEPEPDVEPDPVDPPLIEVIVDAITETTEEPA